MLTVCVRLDLCSDKVICLYVDEQAIPGGVALGQSNGLQAAQAVLALNALVSNYGQAGGVSFAPLSPTIDAYHGPASMQEMADFVNKMKSGQVKANYNWHSRRQAA